MSGHVTMNTGAELSKLAEILAEMTREHQKWLVLIEQHRDAVRHADPRAVERSPANARAPAQSATRCRRPSRPCR